MIFCRSKRGKILSMRTFPNSRFVQALLLMSPTKPASTPSSKNRSVNGAASDGGCAHRHCDPHVHEQYSYAGLQMHLSRETHAVQAPLRFCSRCDCGFGYAPCSTALSPPPCAHESHFAHLLMHENAHYL